MYKCPNCDEKLDELRFTCSTSGWESGSAYLSDEKEENKSDIIQDHESADSGTDDSDSYEYTCPECDSHLNPEDLIWIPNDDKDDEEDEKEIEPEETLHKIIQPKNNILSEKIEKDTTKNAIICKNKKCKYMFVYDVNQYDDKDSFYECPKCGTQNSIKQYLATLNET